MRYTANCIVQLLRLDGLINMDDRIGEFLAKIDLVSVVSKYIRLRQEGDRFWGNCPFHHEKTSSFNVSQSKQVYHCFGCKESGNVISFVKKIENCDFLDGIRILCRDLGLDMPEFNSAKAEWGSFEKKEDLHKLLKDAAIHYRHNLKLPKGEAALNYLKKRGISSDMIVKFGLGVSVDFKSCLTHLLDKGYNVDQMQQAGIAGIFDKSNLGVDFEQEDSQTKRIGLDNQKIDNYYDVFGGRLMVPILDNINRVIGFGGRDLTGRDGVAKYKNSRQSLVFDKSGVVFSINNLKKIKESRAGISYVLLVEGYFDVIALHSAGFDTAVACMGTALTARQARLLKNYSDNVYISFDGDTAGNKATLKSLDVLSQIGLSVRVLNLPQGLDPDNVVQQFGVQGYKELIEKAYDLPTFKINNLLKGVDLGDSAQRSNFAKEACKVVASLSDEVQKEEYRRIVHNYSGYSIETLKNQEEQSENAELQENGLQNSNLAQTRSIDSVNKALDFVMASIVQEKDWVDLCMDIYEYLTEDVHRQIYQIAIQKFKDPSLSHSFSGLYSVLDEEGEKKLGLLFGYEFGPSEDKKLDFVKYLNKIKLNYLEKEKQNLQDLFEKDQSNIDLLKKIQELSNEIRRLKQ